MDWNLLWTILVEVVTLAIFAGIGWTKLNHLEKDTIDLKQEVRDFRQLKQDIAVIQTQLSAITVSLDRLADKVELKVQSHAV